MASLPLSEAVVREHASAESFRRGQDYLMRGAVDSLVRRGNELLAEVGGSEPTPYRVRIALDAAGLGEATCTCPYHFAGWCKHLVAAALFAIQHPDDVEARPTLETLLSELDRDALHALVSRLVLREPALADAVEVLLPTLSSAASPPASRAESGAGLSAPSPTPRSSSVDVRAVRREARGALGSLSGMRPSEAYWHVGGVAAQLQEIANRAVALLTADDGQNALALLEAVTDEATSAYEMVDDSNGEMADFFGHAGAIWTEAILTADLSPADRDGWTAKLAPWADELSDFGIDAFETALAALAQGWDDSTLQGLLAGGHDEYGAGATNGPVETAPSEGAEDWNPLDDPYILAELTMARLNVLERQGRHEAFLDFARAAGRHERHAAMLARLGRTEEAVAVALERLLTAEDAHIVARALREQGANEGALRVGEHGLRLPTRSAGHSPYDYGDMGGEGAAYDALVARHAPPSGKAALAGWVRDLATALGESGRARSAAVIAFEAEPTLPAYLAVQELGGEEWPALREQLLTVLRTHRTHSPRGPAEVFLHEGLVDDAIKAVAQGYDPALLAEVAEAAIPSHPDWVMQTGRRIATEIMDAGRSAAYQEAAAWVARVGRAARAAGRSAEFETELDALIAKHQKKYKLRPMLEKLQHGTT